MEDKSQERNSSQWQGEDRHDKTYEVKDQFAGVPDIPSAMKTQGDSYCRQVIENFGQKRVENRRNDLLLQHKRNRIINIFKTYLC